MANIFHSTQFNSNPKEIAQQKLQLHQQRGTSSNLSIFEVANLMDTILFNHGNQTDEAMNFNICFN